MAAAKESLKVLVRIRPEQNNGNSINNNEFVVHDAGNAISVTRDRKGTSDFTFTEGAVLGINTSQSSVFSHCNLISDVIEGIDCCIMAYGQTGSGKTHSMYGQGWEAAEPDSNLPEISETDLGIVPRSVSELFLALDARSAAIDDFEFSVTCQILQIYNEKIYDLLQDKKRENPLLLREKSRHDKGSTNSVHVSGSSVYRVHSKEDVGVLLRKGLRNRVIRATDFNAESSRSHTILQLFVTVEQPDEQGLLVLKRSTFSLVDLAGSEKWLTGAGVEGGPKLSTCTKDIANSNNLEAAQKEMMNINSSLHVLGNVVSALLEPNRRHIPFRDSSLTRLLQDALGGTGRTVLIATIRSESEYREESFSTLLFASRASKIRMIVQSSEGVSEGITLDAAKKQIRLLRTRLQDFAAQGQGQGQGECLNCNDLRGAVQALMQENAVLRGILRANGLSESDEFSAEKFTSPARQIQPPPSSPISQQLGRDRMDGHRPLPGQSPLRRSFSGAASSPLPAALAPREAAIKAVTEAMVRGEGRKKASTKSGNRGVQSASNVGSSGGGAMAAHGGRIRRRKDKDSEAVDRMRVSDGRLGSRRSASPKARGEHREPLRSESPAPRQMPYVMPGVSVADNSNDTVSEEFRKPKPSCLGQLTEDAAENLPSPIVIIPQHSPTQRRPDGFPYLSHPSSTSPTKQHRKDSKHSSPEAWPAHSPKGRSAMDALAAARLALDRSLSGADSWGGAGESNSVAQNDAEDAEMPGPDDDPCSPRNAPSPIPDTRDPNADDQSMRSLGSLASLAREGSYFEAGEDDEGCGSIVLQGSWLDPSTPAVPASPFAPPSPEMPSRGGRSSNHAMDEEIKSTVALLAQGESLPGQRSFRSQLMENRDERQRLQSELENKAVVALHIARSGSASTFAPPVDIAQTNNETPDPSAPCQRHGLEQCILCIMFGSKGDKEVVTSTSTFTAAALGQQPSHAGTTAGSAAAFAPYSFSSISGSSSAAPAAETGSHKVPQSSSSYSSNLSQQYRSSSFAPFQPALRPPSTGESCSAHDLRDCLLCSLNNSPQRRASQPSALGQESFIRPYDRQPLSGQIPVQTYPSSYTYQQPQQYSYQPPLQKHNAPQNFNYVHRDRAYEGVEAANQSDATTPTQHYSHSALTFKKPGERAVVSHGPLTAPPTLAADLRVLGQHGTGSGAGGAPNRYQPNSNISYEDSEHMAMPASHLAGAASVSLRRQQQSTIQQLSSQPALPSLAQENWPLNPVRVTKKEAPASKKGGSKKKKKSALSKQTTSAYSGGQFIL